MHVNNQFPQQFCDSLSIQCDLGYQEKYDLKVPSTEHEVQSIRIRSIKNTPATYTMINFHSNSKNYQFFVMIFVSSYPVTVMLLLNTYHKCNKSLLVPDVINVYWSTAFVLSIDYLFQFPARKMKLHIRSDRKNYIL